MSNTTIHYSCLQEVDDLIDDIEQLGCNSHEILSNFRCHRLWDDDDNKISEAWNSEKLVDYLREAIFDIHYSRDLEREYMLLANEH